MAVRSLVGLRYENRKQIATESIARGADAVLGKVRQADQRSSRLKEVASQNRAIADSTEKLADQLDDRARILSQRMEELLGQLRAG